MKVQGILDKVVVKPLNRERNTASGINLTQTDFYKKNSRGLVTSAGKGKPDEPMHVKKGDIVWFSNLIGEKVDLEADISKPKDEYIIMPQRDILFKEKCNDKPLVQKIIDWLSSLFKGSNVL